MRAIGTKYDYEALEYQPDVDKKAETYFVATPCRAVLNAGAVGTQRTSGPESKPTGSILKRAFRRG